MTRLSTNAPIPENPRNWRLEIGLSKRYPVDIGGVKRLATISVLLAHFYSRDGKQDEARSLIQEAINIARHTSPSAPATRISDIDFSVTRSHVERSGSLRQRPTL